MLEKIANAATLSRAADAGEVNSRIRTLRRLAKRFTA